MVTGKPLIAIRQLWVNRLAADFQQWRAQLLGNQPDFYLAVWLFEPRFGLSQVVAATEAQQAHYENLFEDATARPLPAEYQSLPGIGLLHWTAYPDVEVLWPAEFTEYRVQYAHRPHWPVTTPAGEACVAVQVGWVWVGQMPTPRQ